MEEQKKAGESIIDDFKTYVNTRKELIKLEVLESAATTAGSAAMGALLGFVGFFILLFASLTIAIALSDLIGKSWSGFLIVTVIYAIVAFIVYKIKQRTIGDPVTNAVIKKFLGDRNKKAETNGK